MMEILILLVMLILLDIAARWGQSSLDGPDSPEWERRRNWYGFH